MADAAEAAVHKVEEGRPQALGQRLEALGEARNPLTVRLSRELITLLSEQLYTSPLKAIEELVVNAFDAEADDCWVFVPAVSPGTEAGDLEIISVYDSGTGMDEAGLADLWRVGASHKREEQIERQRRRKQIGKFGIGKLATYALASRITYITSVGNGEILTVSLSFDEFQSSPSGATDEPVQLAVSAIETSELVSEPTLQTIMATNRLDPTAAMDPMKSWTLVLLEDLKPKAAALSTGRLRWVLSTAMPISGFRLHLNGTLVESSKANYETVAELDVAELPPARLERLAAKTGVTWAKIARRDADGNEVADANGRPVYALQSTLLPHGVSGWALVSNKTIYGGKSRDLTRSHGFFVRVRGRLISADDPLFGSAPLSYEVFNRFRAEVDADDLDADITAPREGAVATERVAALQDLLVEVFYEVRAEYEKHEKARFKQETKREDERNYVYPRFVERPLADALIQANDDESSEEPGVEADESWFYLKPPPREEIGDLVSALYSMTSRAPYTYRLEDGGRDARLVEFEPGSRTFVVNSEHELALAFKDNKAALDLLYDVATAETLLEIYLREVGLEPNLVGEVLERRDGLFRSLAQEQLNSPASIAATLRNSAANEYDLEIAVVVAARALGFVAKHVGNAGRADGVARFVDYTRGQRKITLEAKSSASVPSLGAIDFAGLQQHMLDEDAEACLLVAPSYPGSTREDDSAAASRAEALKISCWTVEQLATVVAALSERDITARSVLEIVTSRFAPVDVSAAVAELLSDPANAPRQLAREVLVALRALENVFEDRIRSVDMLVGQLGSAGVTASSRDLENSVEQLAAASAGAITMLRTGRFTINTSIDEVERRVAGWLENDRPARRESTFRTAD